MDDHTDANIPRTPVATGPLVPTGTGQVVDGWEVPAPATIPGDVTLVDLSSWAKVAVRGDGDVARALGVPFGRAHREADRLVVGSGPGEWLVLAAAGRAAELVASLQTAAGDSFATVIDQSHGRALLRVRGKATLVVLRRLTSMDLDDRFVPQGAALRTTVAAVVTDVVRDDDEVGPSYLLHCERSSGRYLAESLLAAGADLGATLVGEHSPGWAATTSREKA